jgi:AraC-like DNA-binding protein
LLTARAGLEDRIEGLETGADAYLAKPFDSRELLVSIRNLIEQRRLLRDKFRRELLVSPKDITTTSLDEKILRSAIQIVDNNMSDSSFNIDELCKQMAMSRSTLNRKLQALTGLPTNEFIRTLRLKRARQLLSKNYATVAEIAYEVGFNNPSYFSECFRLQFGKLPSEIFSS